MVTTPNKAHVTRDSIVGAIYGESVQWLLSPKSGSEIGRNFPPPVLGSGFPPISDSSIPPPFWASSPF